MSIQINYGASNGVVRDVSEFTTVAEILGDSELQAVLGFGENVEAYVNGERGITELRDGDVIDIRTVSAKKGC